MHTVFTIASISGTHASQNPSMLSQRVVQQSRSASDLSLGLGPGREDPGTVWRCLVQRLCWSGGVMVSRGALVPRGWRSAGGDVYGGAWLCFDVNTKLLLLLGGYVPHHWISYWVWLITASSGTSSRLTTLPFLARRIT